MLPIANINSKALTDFHFECNQGMYFSEYVKRQGYVLLFSDLVEDYYWNFISHITTDLEKVLKETRPIFADKKRQLALYITPDSAIKESNIPSSFQKAGVDAWMIMSDVSAVSNYQIPNHLTIKAIDVNERAEYVQAFQLAYGTSDPNDPYGNLPPAYSQSLSRSFEYDNKGYKKLYAGALIDGKMVGVACMLTKDKIAGIYGVGTIAAYRKQGIATSLLVFLYRKAMKSGINTIMLQTEDGSYNDKLYQKMGFTTIFKGTYYTE